MANTLSITTLAPAAWAVFDTAAMSAISSRGLAGLSRNTARVVSRMAAVQAASSRPSTRVQSTPNRGSQLARIQRQEPNRARLATTWSPAFTNPIRAMVTAAMPEAVVRQASAPSSNARRCSNMRLVGLA